jgi:LysM repeat protein
MDTTSSSAKSGFYITIGSGIVAGLSLVLAIFALTKLSSVNAQLEQLSGIEARLTAAEERGAKAATDSERALARVNSFASDAQRIFGDIANEMTSVRTALNRSTIENKALADKLAEVEVSRVAAAPTGAARPAAGTTTEDGQYVIKAGDTFGKIAGQFNTTISAIQAANPGVDPSRLQIGQKIKLPGR